MNRAKIHAMTLVELTVVILIMSIIASISLTIYTAYVQRARFTAARFTIRQLDMSCRQYQVDLDQFPPSYSESDFPLRFGATSAVLTTSTLTTSTLLTLNGVPGCGHMIEALTQSMSGNASNPLNNPRWQGPYINIRQEQLGDFATGGGPIHHGLTGIPDTLPGDVCLLDPWSRPYSYVRDTDYDEPGTTHDATIIIESPFQGTTQTQAFYNPKQFQIFSVGPNGVTLAAPLHGLDTDDVNNFYTR